MKKTTDRRRFLAAGGLAAGYHLAGGSRLSAASYSVGAGRDASGYVATRRAITASGQFPNVSGKTVVIKPNLVWPAVHSSGITVDPEVVRAVVDTALEGGASQIILAETSVFGANWAVCGYNFFTSYDPLNRIQLVDPGQQSPVLTPVSSALAWPAVFAAPVYLTADAVFINIAKLKVHSETVVSLSSKNVFGTAAIGKYPSPGNTGSWAPRLGLHDRGTHPSIVDLNRMRPSHFAVIDGIWGMEGFGPVLGTAVRMDTVLAGANTLAVDRVALSLMGISQQAVPHLSFASRLGMGPTNLSEISVTGDPLSPRTFNVPNSRPAVLDIPIVTPRFFTPSAGQSTSVRFWYSEPVNRRITVLRLYDDSVAYDLIRTVQPMAARAAGFEVVNWDGRGDDGNLVPTGRYAFHVLASMTRPAIYTANAVGWMYVLG